MGKPGFWSFYEHQAHIKERMRQPVEWQGETWYPTSVAAEQVGLLSRYLSRISFNIRGENVVLKTPEGARFVRLPRDKTDRRAPIYWDLDSLKAAAYVPRQGRPRRTVLEEP